MCGPPRPAAGAGIVVLRADSGHYNSHVVAAAARAGTYVSITDRMNDAVTAFTSQGTARAVEARLIVRPVKRLNPPTALKQGTLFGD
jgi:hypothetical protein